ncbi:hypothetical protein Tco_0922076 [Tanacetum coccineum]|uniref:Uncharacterized protein n=1 Tax=Tanacetum coccineum TaxID=301880 RepID=A0ABQ5CYR8_9ASTR
MPLLGIRSANLVGCSDTVCATGIKARYESSYLAKTVVSSVSGRILSIEARDMDTKLLSAPELNNTLAGCWFRRKVAVTTTLGLGDRLHDKLLILVAGCFQWLTLCFCSSWSDDPPCCNWDDSISPDSFLSPILLLLVIIVAVVIVITVVLVVVVGEGSSIIKFSFGDIIGFLSLMALLPKSIELWVMVMASLQSLRLCSGNITPFSIFEGWANEFHQDKASSVRVPVANFTLQSSV